MSSVAVALRDLTLEECARALGVERRAVWLRRAVTAPFVRVASRLGRELERFDGALAERSLRRAAWLTLDRFGVGVRSASLAVPREGPLLVLSNHPGAYDALALFATLPRDDLRVLARERGFLRAMPQLSKRLVFVPDDETTTTSDARGAGFRALLRHLRRGGAVLHFGAGRIEPDPAFHCAEASIQRWHEGGAALAQHTQRAGGKVVVAVVAGVHSAAAKQSLLVRAAEARGVTTLALLLQLSFRYYAAVDVRVRTALLTDPLPEDRVAATRVLEEVARDVAVRR